MNVFIGSWCVLANSSYFDGSVVMVHQSIIQLYVFGELPWMAQVTDWLMNLMNWLQNVLNNYWNN